MASRNFDPPHPGTILNDLCLQPLGLSVTQAARSLGVSRTALSALLRGKTGVRIHMAVKIARVFGPNPENWLQQQMRYDLWRLAASGPMKMHGACLTVEESAEGLNAAIGVQKEEARQCRAFASLPRWLPRS